MMRMDLFSALLDPDPPAALLPARVQMFTLFDPLTRSHVIKALEGVFISFMFVVVIIRLYVRIVIIKRWQWDDCENSSSYRKK